MAEIKIEKKKPIWPWILVILLILAAIYFFWYYNDNEFENNDAVLDNDTISQIDETAVYGTNTTAAYSGIYGDTVTEPALVDYFTYIDNDEMGRDHSYTNGALMHLINATEAEADELGVDITANLDLARKNATTISNDPDSLEHGAKIKEAATEISNALTTIQTQKFPALSEEAAKVNESAADIDPQTETLAQKETTKSFFENAARLLQKMNESERNK